MAVLRELRKTLAKKKTVAAYNNKNPIPYQITLTKKCIHEIRAFIASVN